MCVGWGGCPCEWLAGRESGPVGLQGAMCEAFDRSRAPRVTGQNAGRHPSTKAQVQTDIQPAATESDGRPAEQSDVAIVEERRCVALTCSALRQLL